MLLSLPFVCPLPNVGAVKPSCHDTTIPQSADSPAHFFRARLRSLRGGVATGGGILSAASTPSLRWLLSALPHHPFSYRVPSVRGNRSKQLAFVFSTAAVQQRKRQQGGGFIVMASALLRHALRQQAFGVVGGRAVGGEKMQRYGGRSKTP
jgi:hypothetical protein